LNRSQVQSRWPLLSLFVPTLDGGGAERVMVNLAGSFAEKDLRVDLVLVRAEGPYLSEVSEGVRVVDLRASRTMLALAPLVRYLRREKPVALLSTLNDANIIALCCRRLAGVRTRLVVRQANMVSIAALNARTVRERVMPHLMNRCYRWADAVIAVSKGVAEDLVATLGLPVEKIRVIYNPAVATVMSAKAEQSLEKHWYSPGQPPVVLGVGRLVQQKDFCTLIRAFARVRKERRARLMILGEGQERPRLEALVRELGLEEDVALPGFVENPHQHMMRAGVFVLSSRWEGFGNVLLEAMAMGTSVVSTNCPSGPAEILEDGKWGKLVPVGSSESLAAAICSTLDDPPDPEGLLRRTMDFSLERIVDRYLEVLLGEDRSG